MAIYSNRATNEPHNLFDFLLGVTGTQILLTLLLCHFNFSIS